MAVAVSRVLLSAGLGKLGQFDVGGSPGRLSVTAFGVLSLLYCEP